MKILALTDKSDFIRMKQQAKKYQLSSMTVVYLSNELQHPRIAFALSAKLVNSVGRNKIRRRIKEAVRAYFQAHALLSYDILFIPKKSAIGTRYSDFVGQIQGLFSFLETRK